MVKAGEQWVALTCSGGQHQQAVLVHHAEPDQRPRKLDPAWATISPPGSALSLAISSAVSPLAIRDSGQLADRNVLEKTTLGMSFNAPAIGPSSWGQNAAQPS